MIDTEKFDKYEVKFNWDITFVLSNSGKSFKPRNLLMVQKINDYEKNFFPIFRLDIQIEDKFFDLIFKTQEKLICNITLTRLLYNGNLNMEFNDTRHPVKQEIAMQDSFVSFFSKIPPDIVSSDQLVTEENIDKADTLSREDAVAGNNWTKTSVYLFHLNSLRSFKIIFNKVFDSADVGTAMAYIINKSEFINKAIVDLPDNKVKYENLILLPYGLRNSFHSLQTRYGVYANGLLAFLDNGTLYCLKALSDDHQTEKDKSPFTRIKMNQTLNSLSFPYIMGIDKSDRSYMFESTSPLLKQNYDVIMGEILGDSMIYSNFDKILSSIEGNGDNIEIKPLVGEITRGKRSHIDTGVKLDIEYDELNNPYNMLSYVRRENTNIAVPITVNGVDLDVFSPEKKVILEIDDINKNIEYGGSYCIRNVIYTFVSGKNVNERFSTVCVARVTLSRVPEDLK